MARSDLILGRIDLGDTQLELASKALEPHPFDDAGHGEGEDVKPNLTGDELTEISAYLYFLKFFDEPGNPTRGKYAFY